MDHYDCSARMFAPDTWNSAAVTFEPESFGKCGSRHTVRVWNLSAVRMLSSQNR